MDLSGKELCVHTEAREQAQKRPVCVHQRRWALGTFVSSYHIIYWDKLEPFNSASWQASKFQGSAYLQFPGTEMKGIVPLFLCVPGIRTQVVR